MTVLVVSAHHDDLELGCGGTVASLVERGHRVVSLVLTHSGYADATGRVVRSRAEALAEGRAAAMTLGYELVVHDEDTMDIPVSDANTCKILDAIAAHNVDTIFTHWSGDTHPVHQRVSTMVMQAARRVPRVFGFAVNWYLGTSTFAPTTFVALEAPHWQAKIAALRCYDSEFGRAGTAWVEYLDRQTSIYGTMLGVQRAEGFVTYKNLLER